LERLRCNNDCSASNYFASLYPSLLRYNCSLDRYWNLPFPLIEGSVMRKISPNSRIFGLIIVAVVLITFISSFNLRSLVDALFLGGAALLSIGGVLAAGLPKLSLLKFTTRRPAESQEAAQEEESRRRNTRIGFSLMLVGLVLIGLCIGVGELILR